MSKETIFTQFFYRENENNKVILHNGFSHVIDECKNIGDLVWVNLDTKLSIKEGVVYSSAFTIGEVFTVFDWGYDNPDTQFIVGGPALFEFFRYVGKPTNVEFRTGSAEKEIFGLVSRNKKWEITVPKKTLDEIFLFSFMIENYCYWGKCIFCGPRYKDQDMFFNTIDNLKLSSDKKWRAFLVTSSADSKTLNDFPSLLEKNVDSCATYIRADKQTYNTLKSVLPNLPHGFCSFLVGVEFPSNRMLKLIQKGVTVEDFYLLFDLLDKYGMVYTITLLVNWNILTSGDIKDLDSFLSSKKSFRISLNYLKCNKICSDELASINGSLVEEKIVLRKGLYEVRTHEPVLGLEQKELNEEAVKIIKEKGFIVGPSRKH